MCTQCDRISGTPFSCEPCDDLPSAGGVAMADASAPGTAASRRSFLRAGAGVVGGMAAAGVAPRLAAAQPPAAADPELARLQGRGRVLLKNGIVLSMDRQVGDFARADVLIEDGRIREVRPDIAVAADTAVVDATDRIVLPGFIDTHHHFYQGLLRGILTNGLLDPDYRRDISNVLTPAYTAADAYAGVLVTALGMIDMGTTTAIDTSQVSHTPEHSDACIRGLQESGMRVVFAYWGGLGAGVRYPQDVVRLRRRYFTSDDQLLTLALAVTLNVPNFSYAREVGLRCVSHGVSDAREPALMALSRAGLLREGDVYIHCNHLSDAAWRLIKDTGGHVSTAVPIEMAMGHGMPPIQDALDHGIRPSLSSDVDATMAQDPFTIMRAAFTLQRLNVLQRKRAKEPNLPALLTCRDVLEFATIEGARAAGLERKIGSLTPGKDADIVMLAADRLNVWPLNNVPGAVVNVMNPGHVETVFIAGQVKKWRGRLVGVDEPRVRRLVREARDGVISRSGFKVDMFA
jgi:cytosine/adenosine deaminase-related metal-dependent hydrolase